MAKERSESLGSDEIRTRIKGWLVEEGHKVQEPTSEDLRWLLQVQIAGFPVLVAQEVKAKDRINLRVQFQVKGLEKFAALPPEKQQPLIQELFVYMISMEVDFTGLRPPFHDFWIGDRVYFDALSKDTLMSRVRRVVNAALLARMVMAKAAGRVAALSESASVVN